jgi:hypothetical protein
MPGDEAVLSRLLYFGCCSGFGADILGNGTFLKSEFYAAIYFQHHLSVFYCVYSAVQPPNGYYLIALFECFPKFFLFFLFGLLWPDEEKVKDNKNDPEQQQLTISATATTGL